MLGKQIKKGNGIAMELIVHGVIQEQNGWGNILYDREGDEKVTHLTFAGVGGIRRLSVFLEKQKNNKGPERS